MAKRKKKARPAHGLFRAEYKTWCGRKPDGLSVVGMFYDGVRVVTCKNCRRVMKAAR